MYKIMLYNVNRLWKFIQTIWLRLCDQDNTEKFCTFQEQKRPGLRCVLLFYLYLLLFFDMYHTACGVILYVVQATGGLHDNLPWITRRWRTGMTLMGLCAVVSGAPSWGCYPSPNTKKMN